MLESPDRRAGERVGPRTIRQLLGEGAEALGAEDTLVSGIAYRSDKVEPGNAFFCIRGFAHDGHEFAAQALEAGATALVVEDWLDLPIPQYRVADTRQALAIAAAELASWPSRSFKLAGITGTNGKTTTTYLLESIMRASGQSTGLIGTVETLVAGERLHSARTTPESLDLQTLLSRMRDAGVGAAAMEVSSHAIDLHRVDGVHFSVAAFTNLTQDHLDFHHTIEEYASVKKRLFTELDVDRSVVNIDDPFGVGIADAVGNALTVGKAASALVRAEDEVLDASGADFTLVTPDGSCRLRLPLAGAFNVSNALVAAGCALALGYDLDTIVAGLQSARQVPGRLERIECGQPYSVIVDYAHTPDSLEKAIDAVRQVTEGRVIVVFGCGGDRDPDKRPMMGLAAGRAADHVVLTSDNPRSEDPVGILLQIEDGVKGGRASYEVEVDRRAAIGIALAGARAGDSVLIAGKGHEDYQIFAEQTIHFDDREVAREVLTGC